MRLRLFDILADGPQTVAGAGRAAGAAAGRRARGCWTRRRRCGWSARRGDGRFGLGALGAALVGNPGIAAMVEHHALLYADLRDPVALLRGERGATGSGALLALCRRARSRRRWPAAQVARLHAR